MAKRGPKPMTSMTDLLEKYGSVDKAPDSAWRRMEANRDKLRAQERAAREAARGDRSHERSILDQWTDNDHGLSAEDAALRLKRLKQLERAGVEEKWWAAHLAVFQAAASAHPSGEAYLRAAFAAYHRYGDRTPSMPVQLPVFRDYDPEEELSPIWDNSGAERGQGRVVGYRDEEPATRKAERVIAFVLKWYEDWQRGPVPATVAEVAKAPRKRATKADMRRRRGAEYTRRSREKNPRPPKPKRTHADYLRAAEKSLATRLAKLAALNAALATTPIAPAGTSATSALARHDLANQIAKCEEGIRRCQTDIEHYRNRAEAAAKAVPPSTAAPAAEVEGGNT